MLPLPRPVAGSPMIDMVGGMLVFVHILNYRSNSLRYNVFICYRLSGLWILHPTYNLVIIGATIVLENFHIATPLFAVEETE